MDWVSSRMLSNRRQSDMYELAMGEQSQVENLAGDYHGVEAHKNKKGAKATEKLTHGEDPWLKKD